MNDEFKNFLVELDSEYPREFEDYKKIMKMGAEKYGNLNWLEPDGKKSSFNQMHDSIFHHVAQSYAAGPYSFDRAERVDYESHLDPLLHAICRCQMLYARLKLGIKHSADLDWKVK